MRRWTPIVWVAIGLLVAYWPIAILVLGVDPYDIYPWGWKSELPAMDTTDNSRLLIAAAAKQQEIDLVMIGSSPANSYTPEQIQQRFPGIRRSWNMSYPGAHPADRALTIDMFLKHSHAKRFIIWIDWSYVLPADMARNEFPSYMYDSSYPNDLKMVNPPAVTAIWGLLHGAGPFKDSQALARKNGAFEDSAYKAFQTVDAMRDLELQIRANRSQVGGPWHSSCGRYPALNTQLIPELREFSRRHVAVDLVFPAYSAAAYSSGMMPIGGTTFPAQLNLRRCVVEASALIPGVAVWAPDADSELISDLANYEDTVHLYRKDALIRILERIGNPAFRIDSTNVESYLDHLHTTVVEYNVQNSNLSKENSDGSRAF